MSSHSSAWRSTQARSIETYTTRIFMPTDSAAALDAHTRDMVKWHFSPETGCPYWLDQVATLGFDPLKDITCFADLSQFAPFDDEVLRKEDPALFIPRAFAGRPYNVFETGGTTGMPKQRIGWDDYKTDYTEFSEHYGPDFFPQGANWLMVGPTASGSRSNTSPIFAAVPVTSSTSTRVGSNALSAWAKCGWPSSIKSM